MPTFQLSHLARELGLVLKGGDLVVSGLNTLEEAGPRDLSFLANPKYARFLGSTKAAAVIVDAEHAKEVERALISEYPYRDFGRALALFARGEGAFSGISPLAFIHPEARLGDDCTVYPFVFIGQRAELGAGCTVFPGVYIGEDCLLGPRCVLYPNAVLMSAVKLGKECVIQPGAVLGAEGFGFTRTENGIQKIPQAGSVTLGDRVEIGANSAVDRGVLGPSRVGDDSKLDNLVQVGHNVSMGRRNLVVALTGIAGSVSIGDGNTFAGQAGISGHIRVGDNTVIGPRSGVAHDVPDNFQGGGSPLMDKMTFLRHLSLTPKLGELYKSVKRLEREVKELRNAGKSSAAL
ncbi:MAG: UDP-3-O-(3-hydroxymyristoyl)glucosamine N-acyltransferase [Deltaproteobacteria bacterium]|jgi:UDP-3-O-[3-hydroxymyristoyl] glucosamine N-acyltransferase|nr:UDP-3-O-(3-hydroxymyristoyl)glucosamine N-acyltransferase [Deltaproteobacteria bacterium]